MLWGYIYFSQLQLDCLLLTQEKGNSGVRQVSELTDEPVAIVDAKHNTIAQFNQSAKMAGITLGMGLATAASLAHNLKVLPYQADIEKQELNYIVECLYDLVSDMAFDWPNGVYIRFGNMLKLYQSLMGLTDKLVTRLDGLSYTYHYASAYNPLAAKILAKSSGNIFTNDGEHIKQRLYALSVKQALPDEYEQLNRLGIKTLAQLFSLPFSELSKRLAPSLLQKVLQLQDKAKLSLSFYQPKAQFFHEIVLLYEVSQVEVLMKPMFHLLKKLERYLQIRAMASQVLTLDCQYRNGEHFSYDIHSGELCDQAEKWQRLISLKLERLHLTEPVVAISISCQQLILKGAQIQDFFNQSKEQLSPLALIGLLQAKLGQDKVTQPFFCSEHQPEGASYLKQVMTGEPYTQGIEPAVNEQVCLRPSYMLPEPAPLNVNVSIVHGPERIETAWWQGSVIRDYFIARNEQGQWCWIFRNHQHQWFIHGYFG